ncbi:unnamed protein product [Sympodiomycopsis kandeliae]
MGPTAAYLQWMDQFKSNVLVLRGPFYGDTIFMADPVGFMHILAHQRAYSYTKPPILGDFLREILGDDGLITAEGNQHRRQKKIVHPAFSVSAVRGMTPIFFKYANQLAEVFKEIVDRTSGPEDAPFISQSHYCASVSAKEQPVFDVTHWLSKVSLDIIAECAFGYRLSSVERAGMDKEDGFGAELGKLVQSTGSLRSIDIFRLWVQSIPGMAWIRYFPNKYQRARQETSKIIRCFAQEIISRKRSEISKEMKAMGARQDSLTKAVFDEDCQSLASKDLLHLTLRANMAADIKKSERLSDEEVCSQMMTFMFAGFETTSTQLQWLLWCLSNRPDVVQKVRTDIQNVMGDRDEVTLDEVDQMTYLDAVCKETMRRHGSFEASFRVATKDDIIPLGKSYPCRNGSGKGHFDRISIKAGTIIAVPLQALNRSKDLWGASADAFDPDRWLPENLPENARTSGLPLHLATFLAGPRGCIGQRFAMMEMKVVLIALLREFDFERVPGWAIRERVQITIKSVVEGQEELGSQMPLRVSRRGTINRASNEANHYQQIANQSF